MSLLCTLQSRQLLIQTFQVLRFQPPMRVHLCLQPRICRFGQNHVYAPYMTVYLVVSLPKTPYIHRKYMWFWPTLRIQHINTYRVLLLLIDHRETYITHREGQHGTHRCMVLPVCFLILFFAGRVHHATAKALCEVEGFLFSGEKVVGGSRTCLVGVCGDAILLLGKDKYDWTKLLSWCQDAQDLLLNPIKKHGAC